MNAKIEVCKSHDNCIAVIINDCEFHTYTVADRKFLIEEIKLME